MLKPCELSDKLNKLADHARLIQLACGGMESEEDAPMIGHEAYKLFLSLRDLSAKVAPVDVDEEIACAKRQFDRRVEDIRESAKVEADELEAV